MSEPAQHTERSVLDALHRRHCVPGGHGRPQRRVIAEHLPDHPWAPRRVLDAVVVDTWPGAFDRVVDHGRGYGLHGIEVKVSRSDLRRELGDLSKAERFTDGGFLTHFSVLAPAEVLKGWRTLGIPETWGVLSLREDGTIRALRAPRLLREQVHLSIAAAAILARRIHATTASACAAHGGTIDPRGSGAKTNWG